MQSGICFDDNVVPQTFGAANQRGDAGGIQRRNHAHRADQAYSHALDIRCISFDLPADPRSCGRCRALPQQIREISQVASAALEANHLPGLSVAVSKDNRIWSAGFGKADLEQDVPVTAQSMFRTASVAKWFTATAAMRLAEDGKLDLDAPVQQYCPQFPQKQWPITSRQLLTHMSGLRHNYGSNGERRDTEVERQALDELIQREKGTQYTRYTDVIKPLDTFKNDPLLFQPGTRVLYSSLGYRLLGCVLEGAAQKPYRRLMRDLVFEPSGMKTIAEDDALAVVPHRVAGYSRRPMTPSHERHFAMLVRICRRAGGFPLPTISRDSHWHSSQASWSSWRRAIRWSSIPGSLTARSRPIRSATHSTTTAWASW